MLNAIERKLWCSINNISHLAYLDSSNKGNSVTDEICHIAMILNVKLKVKFKCNCIGHLASAKPS